MQSACNSPKHFVTNLLVHIYQKKKITFEIAAKVESANAPLAPLPDIIPGGDTVSDCLSNTQKKRAIV